MCGILLSRCLQLPICIMHKYVNYLDKLAKIISIVAIYTTRGSICILLKQKTINHPVTLNAQINWGENSIFNSNILLDANENDTIAQVKQRITNLTGIPLLSQRVYLVTNGNVDYTLGSIPSGMTLKSFRTKNQKISTTSLKSHLELVVDLPAPYLPANKIINPANLSTSTQLDDLEQIKKIYEQLAELLICQQKINKLLEHSMQIKKNWSNFKHLSADQLTNKLYFQNNNTHYSNLNSFIADKDKIFNFIKPDDEEKEVEAEDLVEPLELNLFQDYPRESHKIIKKMSESIIFNLPIKYSGLLKFTLISQLIRLTGDYPHTVNKILKIAPIILFLSQTRHGSLLTKVLIRIIPFKYVPKFLLNIFPAPTVKLLCQPNT